MIPLHSENVSICLDEDHYSVKDRLSFKPLAKIYLERHQHEVVVSYVGDVQYEDEALLSFSQYLIHVKGITEICLEDNVVFSSQGRINKGTIDHYALALPVVRISVPILKNKVGEILLGMRPENAFMPGIWEFPGGKIEQGETPNQAGIRELKEELGVDVLQVKPVCNFDFVFLNNRLEGHISICEHWNGKPVNLHHKQLIWIASDKLSEYDMPLSNVLIFKQLEDVLSQISALPAGVIPNPENKHADNPVCHPRERGGPTQNASRRDS